MKSLRLTHGSDLWLVRYDEESCTVTVEGPAPLSADIHNWLSTPKRVIDRDSGQMILIKPTASWTYLVDVVEVDLYDNLGLAVERVDESDPES